MKWIRFSTKRYPQIGKKVLTNYSAFSFVVTFPNISAIMGVLISHFTHIFESQSFDLPIYIKSRFVGLFNSHIEFFKIRTFLPLWLSAIPLLKAINKNISKLVFLDKEKKLFKSTKSVQQRESVGILQLNWIDIVCSSYKTFLLKMIATFKIGRYHTTHDQYFLKFLSWSNKKPLRNTGYFPPVHRKTD